MMRSWEPVQVLGEGGNGETLLRASNRQQEGDSPKKTHGERLADAVVSNERNTTSQGCAHCDQQFGAIDDHLYKLGAEQQPDHENTKHFYWEKVRLVIRRCLFVGGSLMYLYKKIARIEALELLCIQSDSLWFLWNLKNQHLRKETVRKSRKRWPIFWAMDSLEIFWEIPQVVPYKRRSQAFLSSGTIPGRLWRTRRRSLHRKPHDPCSRLRWGG